MNSKPLLNSDIFIYAANKNSLFYKESLKIIEENLYTGFFVTDLNLIEIFQVITDGKKTSNPYSTQEALIYIHKLIKIPEVQILKTTPFYEVISNPDKQKELTSLNISKFGIYDYLIADRMRVNQVKKIITFNDKAFLKFNWLEVYRPTKKTISKVKKCKIIPYGHQSIDEKDVAAVCTALRSDWLTTGPKVTEFEKEFANYTGTKYAVAVSSGTAALHAAMFAIDIKPGDEVIIPAVTFASTANCVVFQGGTPVFADVDPDTLLIDPVQVEAKITPRTKAIIAVDYAGQPCDYDVLRDIVNKHNLTLIADACHALGGSYKGRPIGSLADLNVFSFHPVKPITTGEGGMITTNNPELSERMRIFRNHGITTDYHQREEQGSWFYEMADLGYNYRITDIQCALGLSQLRKLTAWVKRRQEIAQRYNIAFAELPTVQPLRVRADVSHAYHLYVIRLDLAQLRATRVEIFAALRAEGIGVNVHYIPVHLHPFYRKRFGTGPGMCPVAEKAYEEIITLPLYPSMSDSDVDDVITAVRKVVSAYLK